MLYGGASLGSLEFGGLMIKGTVAALNFPSTSGVFQSARFGRVSNTQIFRSPLDGGIQTAELTGGQWQATFNIKPLTRLQAQEWIVFLLKLQGMSGRFLGFDPANATPQGALGTSIPLIDGVNQVGASLKTKGWDTSTSGLLLAGDAIAFDTGTTWRERHIVAENVDSDSSGNAVIRLTHPMRETPIDNDALITTNASCVMRLIDDDQAVWDVSTTLIFGIEFSGIEVFK